MSNWTLIQIIFNLFTVASIAALWMRLRRPPQDDPRLSRGLQLLQTKITVLEDLSDRTDSQVKQLTQLLDTKNRLLQNKMLEAEQQMMKIDHSMHRSMEVAEIFQDKIPHHEIAERQRTVEYVKAARLANSGLSVDEISDAVALPREQVELIAKFNRDQLMFDENSLPAWATREDAGGDVSSNFGLGEIDFVGNLDTKPQPNMDSMARLQSDFKAAVKTAQEIEATPMPTLLDNKVADTLKSTMMAGASASAQAVKAGASVSAQAMMSGASASAQAMKTGASASAQAMQPAVMSMRATAQTLRDKLVATAEDLLKAQAAPPSGPSSINRNSPVKPPHTETKRVLFPRIEK